MWDFFVLMAGLVQQRIGLGAALDRAGFLSPRAQGPQIPDEIGH